MFSVELVSSAFIIYGPSQIVNKTIQSTFIGMVITFENFTSIFFTIFNPFRNGMIFPQRKEVRKLFLGKGMQIILWRKVYPPSSIKKEKENLGK